MKKPKRGMTRRDFVKVTGTGALAAGVERSTFVAIAIWTFVTLVAPQLVAFSVRAISPSSRPRLA